MYNVDSQTLLAMKEEGGGDRYLELGRWGEGDGGWKGSKGTVSGGQMDRYTLDKI